MALDDPMSLVVQGSQRVLEDDILAEDLVVTTGKTQAKQPKQRNKCNLQILDT